MAQWLRTPVALIEDPGSVPKTHMVAQNIYSSRSRGADAFFWHPWAPGTHVVHRHAYTHNTLRKV